jgi:hypothetical protein
MAHAFLADMGGFILDIEGYENFPLNAKQVHYLVKKGYVNYEEVGLSKEAITDKNKGEALVRLITVVQILWFTLNTLGRAIQRLAITTLELTTLGFIMCALGTYCLWAHKPLDVRSHIYLKPGITMANILEEHWRESPESVQEHFFHTPLDFVGRDDWPWTKYFEYWMGILRKMHLRWLLRNCTRTQKIPDDNFPPIPNWAMPLLFLFHACYGAITMAGWDFHFPSRAERILWHVATLSSWAAFSSHGYLTNTHGIFIQYSNGPSSGILVPCADSADSRDL